MTVLDVSIKHSGKSYPIALDTSKPAVAFKQSIFEATGVPVERMKVMVKGGMLKDDAEWARVAPKAGQTFMVIGAAGDLPKAPDQPVVFLEDLADSDLAKAERIPVGFKNLGNTCYMNATLQTMRAIPELQTALQAYRPANTDNTNRLAVALRDVYAGMERSAEGFVPFAFLQLLRQYVPQFGETNRHGPGYAQQDAEECWTQVVQHLGVVPGPSGADSKFVQQYMMGQIRKELKCIEAPDEPATITVDEFKTVGCNITMQTNFMQQGITDALTETIEKHSPSLDRTAQYTQTARITRLPKNLVVHMVRFAWRRDINKKTKIMRRVKFPLELDAAEWCSEDLRAKMRVASDKSKEIERERRERDKVRKRTKSTLGSGEPGADGDVQMAEASTSAGDTAPLPARDAADTSAAPAAAPAAGGDLRPEAEYRTKEREELEKLVHADLKSDIGASQTGLYELAGIVTHKGASAESGHYIGFVRRDAFTRADQATFEGKDEPEGEAFDEMWYKFDDDKVSVLGPEKIATLEGGGEDSVAYILLYRSKAL
ncbi:cysteine proteinase [Auriculariales sp. MPI-PUGE-AT-0066]|nr:cysteine proteinase [Auriculariales sp. MPI-PUGE-AT-0066]